MKSPQSECWSWTKWGRGEVAVGVGEAVSCCWREREAFCCYRFLKELAAAGQNRCHQATRRWQTRRDACFLALSASVHCGICAKGR